MKNSVLRDCKACGKEVSRYSPFCRQCGHPQGAPLVIWLLVLFLVMMIAFYLAFAIYGLHNVQELRVSGDSRTQPAVCVRQGVTLDSVCLTARGLALSMDHGSQYTSEHFQNEIKA